MGNIYTGYFAKIGQYYKQDPDALFVSIARLTPGWVINKVPHFEKEEHFAPSLSLLNLYREKKITNQQYTQLYLQELGDISYVKSKILYWKMQPYNVYLLCYERLSVFCHRHILAAYINDLLAFKGDDEIIEFCQKDNI